MVFVKSDKRVVEDKNTCTNNVTEDDCTSSLLKREFYDQDKKTVM
jgi:hypothetical protein